MRFQPRLLLFIFLIIISKNAIATTNASWSLGLSYFSQNFLGETSQKPDGSAGFLGAPSYALDLGYEAGLTKDWFWSGRLLYTPVPRSAEGSTADISLTHLQFIAGQNLESFSSKTVNVDWFSGLGVIKEDYKGKGGLVQLSNGTGTATFAIPARTSSSLNGTQLLGLSYSFGQMRFVSEIVFENLFSESKRTQSLVISFLYAFDKNGSRGSRK